MEVWRRSARIPRKKIRNTGIKPKMKVARSFLDDILVKQFNGNDIQRIGEKILQVITC